MELYIKKTSFITWTALFKALYSIWTLINFAREKFKIVEHDLYVKYVYFRDRSDIHPEFKVFENQYGSKLKKVSTITKWLLSWHLHYSRICSPVYTRSQYLNNEVSIAVNSRKI